MNTTKLYQIITENRNGIEAGVYDILLGIVKEELAKECEKAAGRKANVRKAAERMLSKDPTREYLTKTQVRTINGVKYYAQIDGFRMSWSTIDFGFGTCEENMSINFERIIEYRYKNPGTVKVNKADLMNHIKTMKYSDYACHGIVPYTIKFGNGCEIDLNPKYLKDALDFTETDELTVDFGVKGAGAYPVMLHNIKEDRHALVLPIRR